MQSLKSSVLIISHPQSDSIQFGAEFAQTLDEALELLPTNHFQVITIPYKFDQEDKVISLLKAAYELTNLPQIILVNQVQDPRCLENIVNHGPIFKIINDYEEPGFEMSIREALAEHAQVEQNEQLLQLINEQNEKLKLLTIELENRIQKRQSHLITETNKLIETNRRIEALHQALLAIHQASSMSEMERLLCEALGSALHVNWIRIIFREQSHLNNSLQSSNSQFSTHRFPIIQGTEELASIYFGREKGKPFSRSEINFLSRMLDAIALAIDRLTKLELLETLKQQWDATFDAIIKPVCLTDSDGKIVRSNRTFAEQAGTTTAAVIGQNCHHILFQSSDINNLNLQNPCGRQFHLPPLTTKAGQHVTYEVSSHSVHSEPDQPKMYVNIYQDLSEQERLERQILQSAKMAELGTIGSSIAHELNNPLGGMLSFIQLIRMDLKPEHPMFEDIKEMEAGVLRCRDIIENLLSFSRKRQSDTVEKIDLREVLDRSIKIVEIQIRSKGIALQIHKPDEPVYYMANLNALSQCLCNLLNNSIDAISDDLAQGKQFFGRIDLRLIQNFDNITVEVIDNGHGIPAENLNRVFNPLYTTKDLNLHPGLGLTVAYQIIKEHSGDLEITSTPHKITTAKISFSRPVFTV